MDRGVIVGGGLIAASFLVAVLLNRSANNEVVPPVKAPHDLPTPCEQVTKGAPGAAGLPDPVREDCEQTQPSVLKR